MIKSITNVLPAVAKSTGFKILLASTVGIFGVGFVSQSVLASLNASAFNVSTQAIDSGSLSLAMDSGTASAGFTTSIVKMLPGDTQNRYITYTQSGSSTAILPKIRITDANSTLLTQDRVRGLQVAINRCTVPWTVTAGTPGVGTCGGTSTVVLASTPLATIKSADTTLDVANFQLTPSSINYLQFVITLPAGRDESVANGVLSVTGSPIVISGMVFSGGSVTYTYTAGPVLLPGEQIVITGSAYAGTKTIATVPNGTTFTVVEGSQTSGAATGTLGTIQSLTAAVTWTVSETQRAATSTNG